MNEMRKQQFAEAHTWVRAELDRCVNFWLKNGMDPEFGGVYTCLDRTGKIYSTDKSVWMQGRCGWIFAHLCTVYGTKPEWLDASRSCLDFMERHCFNHAAGDRMYFTVTKDGQPLRQRRYCFSEAFCAMANAEYYSVTGDESRLARARQMADLYWDLNHGMEDPVGMGPKTIPETRSGRAFGIPMIYLNVALILMRCDPERKDVYAARATQCVEEIFKYFVKFDLGCTLENVAPDGTPRFDERRHICFETVPAPEFVATALNLDVSSPVIRMVRHMMKGTGEAAELAIIDENYLVPMLFPQLTEAKVLLRFHADDSLYKFYDREFGVVVIRQKCEAGVETIDRAAAQTLSLSCVPAAPWLTMRRTSYTYGMTPVEYRITRAAPGEHQLVFDLN